MKKVNWIIDKYIFNEYEDKLAEAIKRNNGIVHFFDDLDYNGINQFMLKKKFGSEDIIFFHGSLQHGRRLSKLAYYPGIFLTLDNYECFKYYGLYGEYLLNSKYLMFGLNDILRNKEFIFDTFKTEFIFIRPSDGFKSFPGQMLPKDNFDLEFDILTKSYGGLDSDTLVLVSPQQEIEEEFRFIVVDGEIVSGSLYMDKNSKDPYYDKICTDEYAIVFAKKMSKIYQPDRAYTIDICRLSNNNYQLIEINSFCCASLYGNDYDAVVKATNKLCINDYEDLWSY